MKKMSASLTAVAGALVMAVLAGSAGAQCLSAAGWKAVAKPAAWTLPNSGARLVRTAAQQEVMDLFAPIVGMWHVHLVATSTSGIPNPPPPGAEVDAGYQQWHSDGTEMLNSGRPAANTNFCMGVWEQVGPRTFRLNHFAISYTQGPAPDPQSGPTNIRTGPTSIVEQVTVSPDGKTFKGTFTITDYAETDTPQGSSISWLDSLNRNCDRDENRREYAGITDLLGKLKRKSHAFVPDCPEDEGIFFVRTYTCDARRLARAKLSRIQDAGVARVPQPCAMELLHLRGVKRAGGAELMADQRDLGKVFDRFRIEKCLKEGSAAGDGAMVLHQDRVVRWNERSEAGGDLIGAGRGIAGQRNGAECHDRLLAQPVIKTTAGAGERGRGGRMRVNDRVDVGAELIDRQMHAELAGRVPRACNETTAKVDDDGVIGLKQPLTHSRRCDEQAVGVQPYGEIPGRAGRKPEPANPLAEAHQLPAQQVFICIGSCHVDLPVWIEPPSSAECPDVRAYITYRSETRK